MAFRATAGPEVKPRAAIACSRAFHQNRIARTRQHLQLQRDCFQGSRGSRHHRLQFRPQSAPSDPQSARAGSAVRARAGSRGGDRGICGNRSRAANVTRALGNSFNVRQCYCLQCLPLADHSRADCGGRDLFFGQTCGCHGARCMDPRRANRFERDGRQCAGADRSRAGAVADENATSP